MDLVIKIPLTNEHNISYFGNIGIGTPRIVQRVSFNTAAHEIWIANNIQGMNNPYVAFESSTCDYGPGNFFNVLFIKFLYLKLIKLTIIFLPIIFFFARFRSKFASTAVL